MFHFEFEVRVELQDWRVARFLLLVLRCFREAEPFQVGPARRFRDGLLRLHGFNGWEEEEA